VITTTFYCHLCWQPAATLTLDADGQQLRLDGFVWQNSTERVTGQVAVRVRQALQTRDAAALHLLNRLWAPFYCPDCRRIYCLNHWRVTYAFDDDPDFPGWYDAAYGQCPQGHRQLIDD
jgi:hypothetical protein